MLPSWNNGHFDVVVTRTSTSTKRIEKFSYSISLIKITNCQNCFHRWFFFLKISRIKFLIVWALRMEKRNGTEGDAMFPSPSSPLSLKRRVRTPEAHSYQILAFLRRVSSREAGRVQPGTKGDTGEWPAWFYVNNFLRDPSSRILFLLEWRNNILLGNGFRERRWGSPNSYHVDDEGGTGVVHRYTCHPGTRMRSKRGVMLNVSCFPAHYANPQSWRKLGNY